MIFSEAVLVNEIIFIQPGHVIIQTIDGFTAYRRTIRRGGIKKLIIGQVSIVNVEESVKFERSSLRILFRENDN